jgi:hypothetical protein
MEPGGVEPPSQPCEGCVLPLNYGPILKFYIYHNLPIFSTVSCKKPGFVVYEYMLLCTTLLNNFKSNGGFL